MQMLPGVRGEGPVQVLGDRRYRRRLVRNWTPDGVAERTVLWIGMNPSMADGLQDDRTCRREQNISRRFGFSKYLKGNLLDLMETDSALLPQDLRIARSNQNIGEVTEMAAEASWVILAHGLLPPRLHQATVDIYDMLRETGTPIGCFQTNADGSPSHTRALLNRSLDVQLNDIRFDF